MTYRITFHAIFGVRETRVHKKRENCAEKDQPRPHDHSRLGKSTKTSFPGLSLLPSREWKSNRSRNPKKNLEIFLRQFAALSFRLENV